MTAWHKPNDRRKLVGRPWRRLRERILARDKYLCQCPDCLGGIKRLREAHEVDHIVPVAQGGSDAPEKLRAVHRDCHKKITVMQNGGTPRRRIDVSGWPVDD